MTYDYERVATPSSGLRLHLNENTAGCSPAVIEALRSFTRRDAASYPAYDAAVEACARRLGVTVDHVLLTNGLDEGILALSAAGLKGSRPDDPFEAVVVVPAFDMYAACADAVGGRVVEVPLGGGFTFPLDAVLASIGDRTRLVWLTNPNNPTGQVIPRDAILRVSEAARAALVVVDEAYADFSGTSLLAGPIFETHPNIVIGRTFAKAYGLAGLRAGALVAAPEVLRPIRRVVPPYSINACSAAALPVALGDTEYYNWYLGQAAESKQMMYAAFDRLGLRYWPSAANFVLVCLSGDARATIASLAARGVHVRDKSSDPGCARCIRVTAGVVADTQQFISALEEVLCGAA